MADFISFPAARERVLTSGDTTIGIIPDICLVSHFQVGPWQVLYRPAGTGNVKRWGLPLMIPNFSRLKDGIFKDKNTTLPIHGFGRNLPWTVTARESTRLSMQLSSSDAIRPDYPYEFTFTATIAAGQGTLTYILTMENHSAEDMPIAPGFHPYFTRTPEASVTAATTGVWLTDAEIMPTERTAVPPGWDLADGRRVAELALDNVFTGWSGPATVAWPERGARLAIEATQPLLSFLAVYTPARSDFFCVEPASHCTDAINLAREGVAETGLRVLAPGARRSARMTLRPELA